MNHQRIRSRMQSLGIVAALLAVNFFTTVWLQGQTISTAWASVLGQDAAPQTVTAAGVAAIPNSFSYQGVLRNADGSLANGPFRITLRIYKDLVGGNSLHAETFDPVVRDGLFSVVIGDQQGNPLAATIFNNAPLYIGLTIDPDPNEMLPRQRLHPVPWAMQASTALTAVTANNLAPGGGVPGLVTLGAGGAQEITFASGGRITASDGGITISSSDALKPVTINGNWSVNAIHEIGDSNSGPIPIERQDYAVSMQRYVVEAKDNGTSPDTVPVSMDRLNNLCADEDGCLVTLGMRDYAIAIAPGLMATVGPYRFSLASANSTDINNPGRYWTARSQNGEAAFGSALNLKNADGNGAIEHILRAWDCIFTDGQYNNGASQGDAPDSGFNLLNWYGAGGFDNADTVCVLIIDD